MSLSNPVKEFVGILGRAENDTMIQFLKQYQPSAHCDMVELLKASTVDFEVEFYCPDTDNHAYYLAHTHKGIIFAAAIGLSALMYRLPNQAISSALTKGGEILPGFKDNWLSFNPYWPEDKLFSKSEMEHWCRLAYHNAMSLDK